MHQFYQFYQLLLVSWTSANRIILAFQLLLYILIYIIMPFDNFLYHDEYNQLNRLLWRCNEQHLTSWQPGAILNLIHDSTWKISYKIAVIMSTMALKSIWNDSGLCSYLLPVNFYLKLIRMLPGSFVRDLHDGKITFWVV